MAVAVRHWPAGPVVWPSWRHWRFGRRAPDLVLHAVVTACCPGCRGVGSRPERVPRADGRAGGWIVQVRCAACLGDGRVAVPSRASLAGGT